MNCTPIETSFSYLYALINLLFFLQLRLVSGNIPTANWSFNILIENNDQCKSFSSHDHTDLTLFPV